MKHKLLIFFIAGILPMLYRPSTAVAQLSSFQVLGGSTVTNTGPTAVTGGDVGVSPGSAITGFPPGTVVGGILSSNDAVAIQAQTDLTALYNQLAGTTCTTNLTGQDLGGLTLTPGVYCFNSSAQLTGTLTLDAQNNPNAVFLFQTGSTLTTASGSQVRLINSTSNCGGVSWQIGSSATLGTGTALIGSIVALTSITLNTGASVTGRALARNGAVTLDTSPVSVCTAAGVGPTPAANGAPAMSLPALAGLALLLAGLGSVLGRKARVL